MNMVILVMVMDMIAMATMKMNACTGYGDDA